MSNYIDAKFYQNRTTISYKINVQTFSIFPIDIMRSKFCSIIFNNFLNLANKVYYTDNKYERNFYFDFLFKSYDCLNIH